MLALGWMLFASLSFPRTTAATTLVVPTANMTTNVLPKGSAKKSDAEWRKQVGWPCILGGFSCLAGVFRRRALKPSFFACYFGLALTNLLALLVLLVVLLLALLALLVLLVLLHFAAEPE